MSELEEQIAQALRERPKVDDAFEQRVLAGARRRMTRGRRRALWLATATAVVAAIFLWGVVREPGLPHGTNSSSGARVPTRNELSDESRNQKAVLMLLQSADVEASLSDGADWTEIEKPLWQSLSELGERK